MRHNEDLRFFLLSLRPTANGHLHFFEFYTIFTESIDSFYALVRKSVSSIVLHSSLLLLSVDTWPDRWGSELIPI